MTINVDYSQLTKRICFWRYRLAIAGMIAVIIFPIWRYDYASWSDWIAIDSALPNGERDNLIDLPGCAPVSADLEKRRWEAEAIGRLRRYRREASDYQNLEGIGDEAILVLYENFKQVHFRRKNMVATVHFSGRYYPGGYVPPDQRKDAKTLIRVSRELDRQFVRRRGARIELDTFGNYLWDTIIKDTWEEIEDSYQEWWDEVRGK